MRTAILRILATGCVLGFVLTAHAQTGTSPAPEPQPAEA